MSASPSLAGGNQGLPGPAHAAGTPRLTDLSRHVLAGDGAQGSPGRSGDAALPASRLQAFLSLVEAAKHYVVKRWVEFLRAARRRCPDRVDPGRQLVIVFCHETSHARDASAASCAILFTTGPCCAPEAPRPRRFPSPMTYGFPVGDIRRRWDLCHHRRGWQKLTGTWKAANGEMELALAPAPQGCAPISANHPLQSRGQAGRIRI
jgi:hypothetical protein